MQRDTIHEYEQLHRQSNTKYRNSSTNFTKSHQHQQTNMFHRVRISYRQTDIGTYTRTHLISCLNPSAVIVILLGSIFD